MTQMAFPAHGSMGEVVDYGMTLRDYFAAKAMEIAFTHFARDFEDDISKPDPLFLWETAVGLIPEAAYEMADSMLKAREA